MKNKPTKQSSRIRNWNEYNRSLCNRGSLTLWIEQEFLQQWYCDELTGNRGASQTYSDLAIECMLVLKSVYRLALRQVTGFAESIFALMSIQLSVPHYSTLSRRQGGYDVSLEPSKRVAHIVIDSTGLKVYGQGEWHVRQHGASKRRTWRKLHLAVDESSLQIVGVVATEKNVGDCEVVEELLDQVEGAIDQVSADGAYDTWDVYRSIHERSARGVIPPRTTGRIRQHGKTSKKPIERDEHIRFIRKKGLSQWKSQSGYHRRSMAETTIYRYKQICGGKINARSARNQITEIFLNCSLLNRMIALGRPERAAVG